MSNISRSAFQAHPFHLVSPSPWPIFTCNSLLSLTTGAILTMHGFTYSSYWLLCALLSLVSSMVFWFKDVISEATYLGNHTLAVQRGLNMGVALFIVSEALFFLAIFWAYFHSALSPTVELGAQWPPRGIEAINAFELPLLNTVLLLALGSIFTLIFPLKLLISNCFWFLFNNKYNIMYYSLIILFGLVLEGSFFIGEALAEEPIFNLFRNLGPLGNIIGTDLNNMRIWAFVTTMTPDQLQDIYASGWNDPGIMPLGRYNSSGNMSLRLVATMVDTINRDMVNVGDRFNKTQLTSIYLDMMARDIA